MAKNLVKAGLGFGIVSYCLVLLVSRDAPVFTLAIMGALALFIMASSMWILWKGSPDRAGSPQCEKGAEQPENRDEVIH